MIPSPSTIHSQQDHSTFKFVELFAGQAAATKEFRCANLRAARLDLLYMQGAKDRQNPMDLTTPSGFVKLVWISYSAIFHW